MIALQFGVLSTTNIATCFTVTSIKDPEMGIPFPKIPFQNLID